MAPDLTRLQERAQTLADRVGLFSQPCPDSAVRWADASGLQLRMVESPLDIAELVATRLMPPTEGGAEPKRAWIFTSATLGSDAQLSWFVDSCGLADARVLRVASPFNYAQQAAVYVPRSLPRPNDPAHSQALASWLAPAARQLGGRTLVLTTSLRALRSIGEVLEACFRDPQEMAVLVQGKASKRRLLERFRLGSTKGQGGCILVASMSFWEGVDLPGDALQLVVIDKLPFPPPHDPLVEARCRRLEQAGRSSFSAYSIPEAAIALKQGAGRLIRSETDRGILVVGDNRLVTMGYGKRLMAALPPMRRLVSDAEFDEALEALNAPTAFTRASTTVPHCP
jgi:ATP-dependent DNA helicase DinG